MRILSGILFSIVLASPANAAADIGSAGSINIPTGANAIQTTPPEKKVEMEATRLPRRDTKTSLVCTAADSAPKLADRIAEGSCRSHTKEHEADALRSLPAVPGTTDMNAITGR